MKQILTTSIVIMLLVTVSCSSGAKKQKEVVQEKDNFQEAIENVIIGFATQDSIKVNALIDSKQGLTIIFREGAIDNFAVVENIDFKSPIPAPLKYENIIANKNITFEDLPKYNCENETWTKEAGLYCDTVNVDKKMSSMIRFFLDHEMAEDRKVSEETFKNYSQLEENSRRIVLIDQNAEALVFYLTKINNKWQLTLLDRVTTNCGA